MFDQTWLNASVLSGFDSDLVEGHYSLHSGWPVVPANELNYAGYARVAAASVGLTKVAALDANGNRQMDYRLTAAMELQTAPAGGFNPQSVGLYSAASAGTLRASWRINSPEMVAAGTKFMLPAGATLIRVYGSYVATTEAAGAERNAYTTTAVVPGIGSGFWNGIPVLPTGDNRIGLGVNNTYRALHCAQLAPGATLGILVPRTVSPTAILESVTELPVRIIQPNAAKPAEAGYITKYDRARTVGTTVYDGFAFTNRSRFTAVFNFALVRDQ